MIKIGVVGCGYWGPNLVRNFYSLSESKVVKICDLKRERLTHMKSLYPGIQTTTKYEDLLADKNIDAVCIATPTPLHFELSRKALLAGKHILVEKPLADSSKKAMDLIDIANKRKLILMVGHTFLYNPAVNKIKEILSTGDLGRIYYINMERLNLGLFQKDINVVWDLAPHDISVVKYITNKKPISVSAYGKASVYKPVEDMAMIILRFAGGLLAHMRISWIDPHKVRQVVIVGSKKMLVYDDIKPVDKITIYDKGVKAPRHYDSFEEFKFAYRYGDVTIPPVENTEPLKLECLHFLDCVKNRKRPISDGENGLWVIKVVEAIQSSLKNNGRWEKIRWE